MNTFVILLEIYVIIAIVISMLAWAVYTTQPTKCKHPLISGLLLGFAFPLLICGSITGR